MLSSNIFPCINPNEKYINVSKIINFAYYKLRKSKYLGNLEEG
jgi:hypothetical protein